jgi:hypothetical protein
MLGDPTQLPFITILFAVVIFILVTFLPAFLELRKSKDPGPRRVEEDVVLSKYQVELASLERSEETEADLAVIKKIANILSALPNLET